MCLVSPGVGQYECQRRSKNEPEVEVAVPGSFQQFMQAIAQRQDATIH